MKSKCQLNGILKLHPLVSTVMGIQTKSSMVMCHLLNVMLKKMADFDSLSRFMFFFYATYGNDSLTMSQFQEFNVYFR